MSLVKWAFVGLLILPAAEIGALILVAATIGWPLTILAFAATSALGVYLLRKSGRSDLDRLRQGISAEGLGGLHLETPGLARVLGGILLVFPGFVTDIIGAALFVPACRRWIARAFEKAARKRRHQARDRSAPSVIDLEPDEWHQVSDRSLDGRRASRRTKPKSGSKSGSRSGSKSGSS
jgi:UPF0716 protein FxsA